MTVDALWRGDWQAVVSSHEANSRDPGAWLRLAIARWQQGSTDDGALQQALALGASGADAREARVTSAQLSLGQALLLAGHERQGLQILQKALPVWVPEDQRISRARLLACERLVAMGQWKQAEALHGQGVMQLQQGEPASAAAVSILQIETELLSHELSLALQQGALSTEDKHKQRALSRAQLGQDLWVMERLNWKSNGFFVEFGATDGVLLSNTWLLEMHYGWHGICAEPNPRLFARLQNNRHCLLSQACVYSHSGDRLRFVLADAYGGLEAFGQDDVHREKREAYAAGGAVIEVVTTSLVDLLDQHGAPAVIDYLSIDTEGSELVILEAMEWNRYQIRCITVEHNYTAQRESIRSLLESQGYERQEAQWDDWYWKDIP
jgi:FkbM family methyltransferase